MQTSLFLLVALVAFALLLITIHKIWRVHLMTYRLEEAIGRITQNGPSRQEVTTDLNNVYRQFQAYLDLVKLASLRHPLPPLRAWAASPDFLLEIAKHSLKNKPKVIFECSSGASTVVLARCCEINHTGHVFSLEHDPKYAQLSRQMLREHDLQEWATVIDAPLTAMPGRHEQPWYSLHNLPVDRGLCDLLVIDGPPSETHSLARYPAISRLSALLADNCTIFMDDADRPDERSTVSKWLADQPEFVLELIQCEKGCAKLQRISHFV